jgi:hypothetical protein
MVCRTVWACYGPACSAQLLERYFYLLNVRHLFDLPFAHRRESHERSAIASPIRSGSIPQQRKGDLAQQGVRPITAMVLSVWCCRYGCDICP